MIPYLGTKELATLALLSISVSIGLMHGFAFGLLAFGILIVVILIAKGIYSL